MAATHDELHVVIAPTGGHTVVQSPFFLLVRIRLIIASMNSDMHNLSDNAKPLDV